MERLVERDEQESTLAQVYLESCRGRCRLAAVGGPLGSGKTALLESFARDAAEAGATVLAATGSGPECRKPLGIMDQLVRGSRLFSHGAEREVRALLESVGRTGAHPEVSPPILGLLHGAFQSLTGSSPLVLCIDDAHFMDPESLRYLLALLGRMGDAPISVVLAHRPDPGPELGADDVQRLVLTELLRIPDCVRLSLEPLSENGVATVPEDSFGLEAAGRTASECRDSGGRPLRPRPAHLVSHEAAPSALMTAEQLMRIDETVPWMKQVLCEAADRALVGGEHGAAISYLEGARRERADGRERIGTAARRADLRWRHNSPSLKTHPVVERPAAEQHRSSLRQPVPVVRSLLRNELTGQAAPVADRLGDDSHALGREDAVSGDEQVRLWLPLIRPGSAPASGFEDVAALGVDLSAPDLRAAAALGAVLRGTGEAEAVATARTVLREALVGAAGPASSLASLMVLIYSDNLDQALVWCDALPAAMGESYGVAWNAMFTSARAEIHYRLGDLANAERQAYAALAMMPRERWGAAVVVPLSLLILTSTAMGKLREAETHLAFPVPSAAFGTLGGMAYLDARGQFQLARGRHDAALQDFLAAGHLMKLWKADCPSAVPWRADAARAYLHQGLVRQAGELLTEQLSLHPTGHPRSRGLTLRALAATLRPVERPPVLLKAANLLDRCGDALNLAYTLADLGHAYESLGDPVQARRHAHRAMMLADRCAAALQPEPPAAAVEERPGAEACGEADTPARQLSSAEWRVAELAARGSTNEQIARKLFITVSTVEQHLTRAYRKLGIRRRTQLPSCLSEIAL